MSKEVQELENQIEQAFRNKKFMHAQVLIMKRMEFPEVDKTYKMLLKILRHMETNFRIWQKTYQPPYYSLETKKNPLRYFFVALAAEDYRTALNLIKTNSYYHRKFQKKKRFQLYELLLPEAVKTNQDRLTTQILSYGNLPRDFKVEELRNLSQILQEKKKNLLAEESLPEELIGMDNLLKTMIELQNQSGDFETLFSSLSYPDTTNITATFQTAMHYGDYPTALELLNTNYDQITIKNGYKIMLKKLLQQLKKTMKKPQITRSYEDEEDLTTLRTLLEADLLDDAFIYYLEHDFSYLNEEFHSQMQMFMQLVSHQKEEKPNSLVRTLEEGKISNV